eukprot:PhF_6_TR543/c0_g1_i10/m.467
MYDMNTVLNVFLFYLCVFHYCCGLSPPIPDGMIEVYFGAVPTTEENGTQITNYDDLDINITNHTATTALPAPGDGAVQNVNTTKTRTPTSIVLNYLRDVLYIATNSRIRSMDRSTKYVDTIFYDPFHYRALCMIWRPPYLFMSFARLARITKVDMSTISTVIPLNSVIDVVSTLAFIETHPNLNISNVPCDLMRLMELRYFDEHNRILFVPDVGTRVIHRVSLVSNFVSFFIATYAYDIKYHRGYLLYTGRAHGSESLDINAVMRMSSVNPVPYAFIGNMYGRPAVNGTAGNLQLAQPRCLALSCASNHLYISVVFRVVKYSFAHRNFTIAAGTERYQFNMFQRMPTSTANLMSPYGIGFAPDELYICDEGIPCVYAAGMSIPNPDSNTGCLLNSTLTTTLQRKANTSSMNSQNVSTSITQRRGSSGMMKAITTSVLPLASVSVIGATGITTLHSVRIGTLSRLSECEDFNGGQDDPSKHPTTSVIDLSMESDNIKYSVGMFVTNTGISVGFVLLHYLVVVFVYMKGYQPTMNKAKAAFGFPQFSVAVPAFFFQSIISSSLDTCMHAQSSGNRTLGAVFFLLGVTVPLVFVWYVTLYGFRSRYEAVPPTLEEDELSMPLLRIWSDLTQESGTWVDQEGCEGFTDQYRVVFSDYRRERVWYIVIEVITTIAFGVLDAWTAPTDDECARLSVALLVTCVVSTVLLVALRPYHTKSSYLMTLVLSVFFLGSSIATFISNVLSSQKSAAESTVQDTGNQIILWGAVVTVGSKLCTMLSRMGKTCYKDHKRRHVHSSSRAEMDVELNARLLDSNEPCSVSAKESFDVGRMNRSRAETDDPLL